MMKKYHDRETFVYGSVIIVNSQLQAVVSGKTELRQTQRLIIFISSGCQLTSTYKKVFLIINIRVFAAVSHS